MEKYELLDNIIFEINIFEKCITKLYGTYIIIKNDYNK